MDLNFIFVGPQRTGTTWIYKQFENNQGLCFPKDVKETMFFDKYYEKGINWYIWHFSHRKEYQLMGEVAPTYFDDHKARERIHALNPDCKIIITLRHPIERARSLFHHHLRKSRVDSNFTNAIEQLPRIVTAGKYASHVPEWISLFGRENVYLILLDDIKSKPQDTLDRITKVLSISPITINNEAKNKVNAATMPKNMKAAKYAARLATFMRSKRLHKVVEFGKDLGFKKVFSGKAVRNLPELASNEIEMLLTEYEKDTLYVEKLLNRDLTHWRSF